ncbi:MAG: hypothetical protein ACKOZX_05540 [Gammaproteobacteria bacterium]
MLIENGRWHGKGTLLLAGNSLGVPVSGVLSVQREDGAYTMQGECAIESRAAVPFSLRLHLNHEGLWTVAVYAQSLGMEGMAKLESEPHLAMLWDSASGRQMSVALFAISGGVGCRGFLRQGDPANASAITWEIAWRPDGAASPPGTRGAATAKGGNVFSLRPFRKR